jgi:Protein of unknown function (DUF3102)/ParB-like nuclease domain
MSILQTKNLKSTPKDEIHRLHSEINSAAESSLKKAIRIGELLIEQKKSLPHGKWLPWLESNVPFSERSAQNYMLCFDRREYLKSASVADLAAAYHLLTDSKPDEIPLDRIILEPSIHCRANVVERAVIDDYAEDMRNGAQFPPIDVFKTERGLICADGHHRVHAARRAGFDSIAATIHSGTFEDCVKFAVGCNCEHGLRRKRHE